MTQRSTTGEVSDATRRVLAEMADYVARSHQPRLEKVREWRAALEAAALPVAAPMGGDADAWLTKYRTHLLSWKVPEHIALAMTEVERSEIAAGDCDCLTEIPEDVAETELHELRTALAATPAPVASGGCQAERSTVQGHENRMRCQPCAMSWDGADSNPPTCRLVGLPAPVFSDIGLAATPAPSSGEADRLPGSEHEPIEPRK